MSTRLVLFPTPNPLPPLPPSSTSSPIAPAPSSTSSSTSSTISSNPPSPSLSPSFSSSSFHPFSHSSPIPSPDYSLSRPRSSSVSSVSISIFTSPSPPDAVLIYSNPPLFQSTSSASASASTSCLPSSSYTASPVNYNRLSTSSSFPSVLPPPTPFYKHHSTQHHSHLYPPQTVTSATTTNYGSNPGAIFSVRNVNVDSKELLSHLPPSQTQTQVYTHQHLLDSGSASGTGSASGYGRQKKTRRHLQELAQEQYRQNHQVPLNNDENIDDIDNDEDGIDDQAEEDDEEPFDELQYRFETLQEPFTHTEYHRHSHRRSRSGRDPVPAPQIQRRPVTGNDDSAVLLQQQQYQSQTEAQPQEQEQPSQRRTRASTRSRVPLAPLLIPSPSLPTSTIPHPPHPPTQSATVTKTRKGRISSDRSLGYFSRIFKRLSRLNCTCGPSSSKQPPVGKSDTDSGGVHTESQASVQFPPQLTAQSSLSSLSTDISGSIPSIYRPRPQHPGSKRRRQKKAAAATAAASSGANGPIDSIKTKTTTPSYRNKGKQRAKSRSRSGSLLGIDEPRGRRQHQHQHLRQQRSLSLSTIHTWCPYCYKTVPSQDQSDHHHRHHFYNLISPTRTPLRIESDSSRSSSRSFQSRRPRSPSPYPYPSSSSQQQQLSSKQQQKQRQRSRSVTSLDTVRSSVLSLSSKKSYLSSDIEVVIPPAAHQVIPNTLFTFAHPLPHQQQAQTQTEATATATTTTTVPTTGTTTNTAPLPALAALTPTAVTETGAVSKILSASTAFADNNNNNNWTFPNYPLKEKLSLTLSASTPSPSSPSSSLSSSLSCSSRIPSSSPSPSPPQGPAPLPPLPHPQLVVFASTPAVSSASSSSSSPASSPSSAVVVRRSKSARAPQRLHRPQESKLEVSGNRFLFVSALDTPPSAQGPSTLLPSSTIAASSSSSPPLPSSPVVNLNVKVKDTPLPPLPSSPPPTIKRRPLSWAFSSPSSFTFTHPFKNKQKDKHSTYQQNTPTTTTTDFPAGSQQQQQQQQQKQQQQGASVSGSVPLSPSTPCAPSPPPLFIQFVRGLGTHPWFSDPSTTDEAVNIRDIYPHFGSGGGASGGITGGSGLSNSHPKGASFDDPALFASPSSAKRRSWTTFFPFRSRRSSMPAASLSATSAPSAGATIIPTSPSTSAVYQHSQHSHHHQRYQSQQIYPVPQQQQQRLPHQQDQPQKKRSGFKRFSAPAPARKMEVLTIQQQEALLPAMPSTTGGHYPSALEGTGQVISVGRGRGSAVYDHNKPLPAIVAEGESDDDDVHTNKPAPNEPVVESSQGQSHVPPPAVVVLPTISLPAAPTPSLSASQPSSSTATVAEGGLQAPQQQQQQQQQQQPTVAVVKKHQRRMSFLPSSLMTSNLAKFISGTGSTSNNNNSSQTTSPTAGSSTGGPTLTSSSNAAAAAGGGAHAVGGGQGHGQGGMGGGREGGATTTLNPTSLWSSRSTIGEGESFQADGIPQGRNLNTGSINTATTATAAATNTALTIEQFKWSMICCCNEIKTRVFKQQQQQRQGSPDVTPHAPSLGHRSFPVSHNHLQTNPAAALPPLSSTSNKKAEKNKSRSSNGNGGNGGNNAGSGSGHLSSANNSHNTTAAIEQAAQDSRATLQALLLVMTSSSPVGMDKDRDGMDPSALATGVQGYRGSTATGTQAQNHSLLSLIGQSGGVAMPSTGAAPPVRSHSMHHLSRYSSHPALATTAPGAQPSGAPTTPLRNNRSQLGMTNSYAQATNAILNPLSLQELALLFAYLLSIAPEQWIPWHLYDFFIRPQGRSYKDLIEMLPTHSQRILKALLETVEALIDYATVAGLQQQRALLHQQQSQQHSGPTGKQPTLAHLRSRSEVDPGHSRNNGGYGVGGNPMMKSAGSSTLSLARALAILEPPFSAQELQQLQQQEQMKQQQQQQASLNSAAHGGDTVHQEIALRGRKRRVILDSLSGLVFRPRAGESHRGGSSAGGLGSGAMGALIESPTDNGFLSPEEKGNGSKSKAMRRRSFLGAATASSGSSAAAVGGPSPAAVALQLQMSEREREAGHLAFENLVSAFEIQFVRPLPPVITGPETDAKAKTAVGGTEAGIEAQDELPNVTLPQNLVAAGSVARIRSSASTLAVGGQGVDRSSALPLTLQQHQQRQLPPRQARSLPTTVSAPTDLAAVRSLSLPPWRKKHHSALQLGQHPPVSSSIASAARQEWLPQYPFQSQSFSQQQQQQQQQQLPPSPLPPTTVASMAGSGSVPLNRVQTVSTNSIAESSSVELLETLQEHQQQQNQHSAAVSLPSVSASGSTVNLPAIVQSLAVTEDPDSLGALGAKAGSSAAVGSEKAPIALNAEDATVEVRPRGGPSPITANTDMPVPATLPRRSSRRSSTRKDRPMSLDNGVDAASMTSSKLMRTRTLSGTISSTWTAWKDHLLVLEEEEYVIEDSSESPSISSVISSSSSYFTDSSYSGSEDEVEKEGGGGGDGNHDNEHDGVDVDDGRLKGADRRRKEKKQERRRRKEAQETVSPAGGGGEGGERTRTNKSSGTFGDLRALAAAIAASQQRQQQQQQQQQHAA